MWILGPGLRKNGVQKGKLSEMGVERRSLAHFPLEVDSPWVWLFMLGFGLLFGPCWWRRLFARYFSFPISFCHLDSGSSTMPSSQPRGGTVSPQGLTACLDEHISRRRYVGHHCEYCSLMNLDTWWGRLRFLITPWVSRLSSSDTVITSQGPSAPLGHTHQTTFETTLFSIFFPQTVLSSRGLTNGD